MNVTIVTDPDGNQIINENDLTLVQRSDGELLYVAGLVTPDEASTKTQEFAEEASAKVSEFSEEATKLLLTLYLENKSKFRNPKIKKITLWKELARSLSQHGYNFTEQHVERKFRNMKSHFLKIKDNNTKTGRGRKSWPYFDIMEDIHESDACVNPTLCISSMADSRNQPTLRGEHTITSQSSDNNEASELPSGYDMIKTVYPNTEMLPENATPAKVRETTRKRRLFSKSPPSVTKLSPSLHAKKVRKTEPHWLDAISSFQDKQTEHVESIKAAIENSNKIQQERNDVLKKLLKKL